MPDSTTASPARRFTQKAFTYILVLLTLGFASESPLAQPSNCVFQKPREVDISKVEPDFRRHFCSAKSPACDKSWTNFSYLLKSLVADGRIPTVGTVAYMLATARVESNIGFDPGVVEYEGTLAAYAPYYGRGWAQLTHQTNYADVSKALAGLPAPYTLNVDLVKDPELARRRDVSYAVLVQGMTDGWIEGYRDNLQGLCPNGCKTRIRLSDFVNGTKADYANARAVINANCQPVDVFARAPKQAAKAQPQNVVATKSGKLPCADVLYDNKGYIPTPGRMKENDVALSTATWFDSKLCTWMVPAP